MSQSEQLSAEALPGFRKTMGGLCRRNKFQGIEKKIIIISILMFSVSNSSETISCRRDFDNAVLESNSEWLLEVVDKRCGLNDNLTVSRTQLSDMFRGIVIFATVNVSDWRDEENPFSRRKCPNYVYFPHHARSVRSGTAYTGSTSSTRHIAKFVMSKMSSGGGIVERVTESTAEAFFAPPHPSANGWAARAARRPKAILFTKHEHHVPYVVKMLALQFGADLTFAIVSSKEPGVTKAFGTFLIFFFFSFAMILYRLLQYRSNSFPDISCGCKCTRWRSKR